MKIKKYIGVSLDSDIFDEVEKRRGMVKRSTFVNDALKKALFGSNKAGDT